jgi:Holliday junction DNA helicase RuvA
MIARLRGEVAEVEADRLVVDVQGVGYDVLVPGRTAVSARVGAPVILHVHTAVREDAITLFGFESPAERRCFEQLLGVNGVGPRMALSALGALAPDVLARAVNGNDLKTLTGIPGIGKKTAERLVLELKGKLEGGPGTSTPTPSRAVAPDDPLPLALAQLGYKRSEIESVVARLAADGLAEAPSDQRLAAALRVFAAGQTVRPGERA